MNRTPEGPGKQWTISVQKVCCPQSNGGVVDQIKWTREHTLSSDILVPDHVYRHLYTSKARYTRIHRIQWVGRHMKAIILLFYPPIHPSICDYFRQKSIVKIQNNKTFKKKKEKNYTSNYTPSTHQHLYSTGRTVIWCWARPVSVS